MAMVTLLFGSSIQWRQRRPCFAWITRFFAANAQHPEIILHYNNADSLHNQARFVSGMGEFTIAIPRGHYESIYLRFNQFRRRIGAEL